MKTLTRRNVLTVGATAAIGSSLYALPVKQLTPIPATPPPSLPPSIHLFFQNSYLEAKAGGMTKEHLNQLIGVSQTLFGQWSQDGTLDALQAKLTPAYIAGFQFDKQALADSLNGSGLGYQVDPNDLVGLEAQFNDLKPQMPTNVKAGLQGVMTALGTFEMTAPIGMSATPIGMSSSFNYNFRWRRTRIFKIHEICMPAIYGAFTGLLALAAGEVPPAAIALGILAFIFELEAILVC